LLTWPSWANALVVPDGFDWKLSPSLFAADQVIVAWDMSSFPEEPGVLTGDRFVTGPLQRMSKLHVAATDTGSWKRKSAFGMLKKSWTARSVAVIRASPAPNSTLTASGARSGSVQNRPPGYGVIPGSKS
jgi:hypothetical protein